MATLASLVVKIGADTRDLRKKLSTAQKKLIGFEKSAISLRKTMEALAGAAGLAFAVKKVFDLGAAVEETASKFDTVFGPAADSLQTFIDDFGVMAGLSNTAAKEVLATTGAIVQGMGFAQEASAAYAEQVVTLAGDLSSFNNIPIEETARAIQSAITGERESLKRLGIVILETDVQKQALVETGKENAKALTQEDKAASTLTLITKRAGVAMGDLVRTQGSAANVARRVGARWENLKEIAATSLMPVMAQLLGAVDDSSGAFDGAATAVATFSRVLAVGVGNLQIMGAQAAVLVSQIEVLNLKFRSFDEKLSDKIRAPFEGVSEILDNIVTKLTGLTRDDIGEAFRVPNNTLESLAAAEAGLAAARESAAALALAVDIQLNDALNQAAAVSIEGARKLDEFMRSGKGVADQTRTMTFAVADAADGFADMEIEVTATKNAIILYNQELTKTEQGLLGIASALGGLAGGGGFGGFFKSALKLGAAFIPGAVGAVGVGALATSVLGGAGFDAGGTIPSGKVGIVGEKGPELVSGPANVTSRVDTASMMGGDANFTFIFEQEGVEVRRISKKIKRNESLSNSLRLALPAPVVG